MRIQLKNRTEHVRALTVTIINNFKYSSAKY